MKFSMLLQYITPHRKVLLGVVALLLAGSAVTLAQPWLAGQLTSVILAEERATPGACKTYCYSG
jgi:ABC-type multidrug transport system fused ATPase/permease subunit